jgi:hypothetical protein
MRHTPPAGRAGFLLAALCWLAAGPGAAPLGALAECRHEEHAHHQHGTPAPTGPCFCGEMHADGDLTLPAAATGHDVPTAPTAAFIRSWAFPAFRSPRPAVAVTPESPPPESLA